jgi:hypothetical protein
LDSFSIEQTKDLNNQKTHHRGVVDLVLFDGVFNVQNARKLVSITYPRITVVHCAEHVGSLLFKVIFTKMPVFQCSSQFLKWCRNTFGSTCQGPHAIFKKHSIMSNNHIYIRFIKISKCRMRTSLLVEAKGYSQGDHRPQGITRYMGKSFQRERSLFLKTMSTGSIYFHCVVLSMHQCVSFD